MSEPPRDTIFALSSGRPPAAIGVVRVSGPRAGEALKTLTGKIPAPRAAALARVRDPQTAQSIDQALVLWFPGPGSETGEDTAELQLHGGRAVIAATLAALGRLEGLRPAEAGEFTRRAFENGKLDLTAVEGLADLLMAETEGQRRQALRQLTGALGKRAEAWRQRLIEALALVEARIDFSDEADLPENLLAPALASARELAGEIAAALADGGRGERLREGLVVAIAGPPNAGKSTLLNRIARREAAIVSPYAGTTRDVIEVHLDLDGWPVTLLDTAGIRETDDPVELEGVRRAQARAEAADLVLWVVDAREAGESAAVIPGRAESANPESISPAADYAAGAEIKTGNMTRKMLQQEVQHDPQQIETERQPIADVREEAKSPPVIPGRAESANPESITRAGDAFRGQPPHASERRDTPASDDEFSAGPGASPPAANSGSDDRPVWLIRNKIDLLAGALPRNESELQSSARNERLSIPTKSLTGMVNGPPSDTVFNTSAVTGNGFEGLLDRLAQQAAAFLGGSEPALVTRERHRHALQAVLAAVNRAQSDQVAGHEDLIAEELRTAAQALGRLTGRVDVEDILDVIFRDFCIGK